MVTRRVWQVLTDIQVAFGGLDDGMTQAQLDLFQRRMAGMRQLGECSAEIVRRQPVFRSQTHALGNFSMSIPVSVAARSAALCQISCRSLGRRRVSRLGLCSNKVSTRCVPMVTSQERERFLG